MPSETSRNPVWVGTYNYYHAERFESSPGVNAWYDYHWSRGMHWHFKMLHYYRGVTKKRNGTMGKWMLVSDYNRNLYLVALP